MAEMLGLLSSVQQSWAISGHTMDSGDAVAPTLGRI